MKRLVELLLCCLGLVGGIWAWPVVAATAPLPRIQTAGRDWHDLGLWARANRLSFKWDRPARTVQVASASIHVTFGVDSQQAVLNGVKVWLSFPITPSGAGLLVSVLDVEKVLNPILNPKRQGPWRPVRTIMLDPGHGGKDPGNQEGSLQEKRYTLLLAQQVRAKLQAAGYQVVLTRSRDAFVELTDRAVLANRTKADLFLSLHFNSVASRGSGAEGIETFCLTPHTAASTHAPPQNTAGSVLAGHKTSSESVLLAYQLQKALVRRLNMTDRGVKHARFVVLRDATMPAVLIEGGFMSDRSDLRKITDPAARGRMADAIVEAVRIYRQQIEIGRAHV